jgi:hypothetical protein
MTPEKKRFYTKYKNFLDMPLIQKNPAEYGKRLSEVGKLCSNIDFTSNILVIYKDDIAKDLFLTGFSKLTTFRSSILLNVNEFLEILFGNRKDSAVHERSIDSIYDIDDDVLCLTISYHEPYMQRQEDLAVQSIITRYNTVQIERPVKLTWVFCMGFSEDLLLKYPKIKYLFEQNSELFKIYNLNPKGARPTPAHLHARNSYMVRKNNSPGELPVGKPNTNTSTNIVKENGKRSSNKTERVFAEKDLDPDI